MDDCRFWMVMKIMYSLKISRSLWSAEIGFQKREMLILFLLILISQADKILRAFLPLNAIFLSSSLKVRYWFPSIIKKITYALLWWNINKTELNCSSIKGIFSPAAQKLKAVQKAMNCMKLQSHRAKRASGDDTCWSAENEEHLSRTFKRTHQNFIYSHWNIEHFLGSARNFKVNIVQEWAGVTSDLTSVRLLRSCLPSNIRLCSGPPRVTSRTFISTPSCFWQRRPAGLRMHSDAGQNQRWVLSLIRLTSSGPSMRAIAHMKARLLCEWGLVQFTSPWMQTITSEDQDRKWCNLISFWSKVNLEPESRQEHGWWHHQDQRDERLYSLWKFVLGKTAPQHLWVAGGGAKVLSFSSFSLHSNGFWGRILVQSC